jgi:hypothetical protein
MIGNPARPGGSLGKMLHQLRGQAKGAAPPFMLQVLATGCGPSLHLPQCSIIPAFGVIADTEGGAAACCLLPRLAHGRVTHAGPSTRHNRGTPARGLAQVVVTYGRVRNLPSLGLETPGLACASQGGAAPRPRAARVVAPAAAAARGPTEGAAAATGCGEVVRQVH